MQQLAATLATRLQANDGQTMVEYSLILALISVVPSAILIALGGQVVATFTSVSNAL